MSCNLVIPISGSECIGDSRVKINNNFDSLCNALNSLSGSILTPITTPTIVSYFDTTTRRLSSYVRNDSITTDQLANNAVTTAKLSAQAVTTDKIAPDTVRYSQLASWQTLSASPTLSAEAVQPGLAKAWVRFDGTTTTPTICAAYNISSVTKSATGRYVINFTAPLKNTNYIVTGNSGMLTSGHNASVVTFFYTPPTVSSFGLHLYRNYDGAELDSQYVNVVVYSF